MTRVGLGFPNGWIGGVNYIRNLLLAVEKLERSDIEFVLLTGKASHGSEFRDFPSVKRVSSVWFDQFSSRWAVRQVSQLALPGNVMFEKFLRNHGIDILSHSDFLGASSGIPSICWIPDFQHHHIPGNFTRFERAYRNREFRQIADRSTRVIVSSNAARSDLQAFRPTSFNKARVVQFVADTSVVSGPTRLELDSIYNLPDGPYFYLPNQYWAHKNHEVVISALERAKSLGSEVTVISTGATEDYRNQKQVASLLARVAASGLANSYRVLGVVPYSHVVSLMKYSVAVINPSRSEGWSTSVEEAKSLGKPVILSNIAVHLEQNPNWGFYFDPDDSQMLLAALESVLEAHQISIDAERMVAAKAILQDRIKMFGQSYLRVIEEVRAS